MATLSLQLSRSANDNFFSHEIYCTEYSTVQYSTANYTANKNALIYRRKAKLAGHCLDQLFLQIILIRGWALLETKLQYYKGYI